MKTFSQILRPLVDHCWIMPDIWLQLDFSCSLKMKLDQLPLQTTRKSCDNQKCQAESRPLCNKIPLLFFWVTFFIKLMLKYEKCNVTLWKTLRKCNKNLQCMHLQTLQLRTQYLPSLIIVQGQLFTYPSEWECPYY